MTTAKTTQTIIQAISTTIDARARCQDTGNTEWFERWTERLQALQAELPSGSGWDNGTTIDLDRSKPNRIVLYGSFHHMDDSGSYDGWTEHEIIVTPAFSGVDVKVTGRNRNDIKDYLAEMFDHVLSSPAPAVEAVA